MSTAANAATPLPVKVMEVQIRGKVMSSRHHMQKYYTLVAIPAPDSYSSPQRVEIRSNQRVGGRDEEITLRCRLGGFEGRAFEAKDKETGEVRKVRNVIHTLDAVE